MVKNQESKGNRKNQEANSNKREVQLSLNQVEVNEIEGCDNTEHSYAVEENSPCHPDEAENENNDELNYCGEKNEVYND
jgi:hypothetical protein